jgi:hypothetical protein
VLASLCAPNVTFSWAHAIFIYFEFLPILGEKQLECYFNWLGGNVIEHALRDIIQNISGNKNARHLDWALFTYLPAPEDYVIAN